ncbi:unnamed protein product [Musa acuminata subsp. malaccensis]|uniref:(wild Malaysian banana) hypothetical protein n=1 Tax=Musa acuminata subsp. malaccensis TaxID=214687 RepID=A0A804HP89_MUSAM|nr:PREDICTED: uncharacterized protein LOC103980302 [Musa acuminata subsp. malaccensis]CAG1858279.1 unnamed protein product [Musa acuminata subsp. malaccensis]
MSLENEDRLLLERKTGSQKKSKILYTRDELLSFSNLDICKKLPRGIDASILSELDEASVIERQRGFGGLTFQSTKRSDYGSSPPNRLEGASSYFRGSSGRWDARSSGSDTRDGDLPSNRESSMQDSGRRYGQQQQSRHLSQNLEHDGLLGSGAFPRPSGYAGSSGQKARATSQFQLNRTSEPYQPPRPYKALSFQRKDDKDSCNDETFGSTNYSSEDRAEEERRRRASFELMRKEQQKALQEKPKQIPDNHKENLDADIIALLQNSVDRNSKMSKTDMPDDSSLPQNDSSRVSSTMNAPLSRPLVPPGFSSTALDKNLPVQSSSTQFASEGSFSGSLDDLPPDGTDNDPEKRHQSAVCLDNSMLKTGSMSDLVVNVDEKLAIPSSALKVKLPMDAENISCSTSGSPKVNKIWEEVIENDVSNTKEEKFEVTSPLMQDSSVSILEKLLGGSVVKTSGSSPTSSANQGFKTDEEPWVPAISESSKFASWFLEEENKHVEDFSSKDLLSLIVNNEKVNSSSSIISCDKAIEHMAPSLPIKISDTTEKLDASSATSLMVGIPEQYHQGVKPDLSPAVLTCEDLEQSFMANITGRSSPQHAVQGPRKTTDGKMEQKLDIDDHASQHLLSLLQKGTKKEKAASVTPDGLDAEFFDKFSITDANSGFKLRIAEKATSCNSEPAPSSEKTLTLEALFGAAFMNELQSAQAPVSVQRVTDGGINTTEVPTSLRLPFQNSDAGFFPSSSGDYKQNKPAHEMDMVSTNQIQDANVHHTMGPSKEHENSLIEDSKHVASGFEERALQIHLPDEDNLITTSDSLDSVASGPSPFPNATRSEELLSENSVEHLNYKLLNAITRDAERIPSSSLDGLPPFRTPHDLVGSDSFYHHLQGRTSPQLPHIINHARPLHPGLDHLTNRNQQMKFIGPEGIHHDPRRNLLENVVPLNTPNYASGPHVEPPDYHLMLQQMPIPGSYPQQLPLPGFPRGVPLPHHLNHMQGYIPEMNNVHNISLHQQHPTYGSLGMGMPGSLIGGGGGNHPEALQRLIDMELRANAKQVHPASAGHIPGIYGPEFDRSFRYR